MLWISSLRSSSIWVSSVYDTNSNELDLGFVMICNEVTCCAVDISSASSWIFGLGSSRATEPIG